MTWSQVRSHYVRNLLNFNIKHSLILLANIASVMQNDLLLYQQTWNHIENITTAIQAQEQQNELLWMSSNDEMKNISKYIKEELTYNLQSILLELDEHKRKLFNMSWSIDDINNDMALMTMSSGAYFNNITVILESLSEPPGIDCVEI